MFTMLNSFLFCGFHGRVFSILKPLHTIFWENWIQTSFLNPSPNSRKASWFFLRNSGIICLDNFTVATDCLACLELVLHFCSLFLLTNCSHRQSGVNQSFLMFRGVTRSQGREGSSVNYSLTAPATISPDSSLHFWCANTEVGIIFKTREEQNPPIYPSDRSKLNSSRIIALAVCGSLDNRPGR